MFYEVSLRLYNASSMFLVYILLGTVFDFLSIGLGAFVFVWKITDDIQFDPFLSIFRTIWCVYYFYKSLALAALVCSRSSAKIWIGGTTVAILASILSSGFLKYYC